MDNLICEVEKAVEQQFDTKVNACGILRDGDEKLLSILRNENSYSSFLEVGYLVVPVLINQKKIIFNTYYKKWRFNHSPTRLREYGFDINTANLELNGKLQGVNYLLKFIEGFTSKTTISVVKFFAEPFENNPSKIVDDFDTLQKVLKENDIENCAFAYIFLYFNVESIINNQLLLLDFPPEIKRHNALFSTEKLIGFINQYISALINKYGIARVQSVIDTDNNPHDPVINYITWIMHLAMLHELFHQSFTSSNSSVLQERLEYLVWAINISVANILKIKGIERIPSLSRENGQINIYYSWNNLEIIIEKIMPIASWLDEAKPNEALVYIDNLIRDNLK